MTPVGMLACAGGGARCVRGTRDGVVQSGAPRGVGCLRTPVGLGCGDDGAGGVNCGNEDRKAAVWVGVGVLVLLVVTCSRPLREWRPVCRVHL